MAEKKTNREKLKEITESIEQGIKELFQSDKYANYLRTMSRFHSYSARNVILIHMQRPDATAVAGFNAWKKKFQRHVKKGEKGITILAPTPFKKTIEEKKLDPVTKAPVLDQNGNAIIEEKEIEIPMFRPVKVFDVSQTEGKPLPQLGSTLAGDVRNYEIFMEALHRTSPVPIKIGPISGAMDGFFSPATQSITVRDGMSQVQTISVTVHEITHSLLHNREQDRLSAVAGTEQAEKVKPKDRNTEEVEAESVSYAVCQYYGIETGEDSFGYIASWSKDRSLPELKASLETIGKTANQLINDIDRHFKEICKERGIDLTQPEQAATEVEAPVPPVEVQPEPPQPLPDEALYLVDDTTYLHIQLSEGSYDYTLYDKETMRQLDGGQMAVLDVGNPQPNLRTAADMIILGESNLTGASVEPVPLEMVNTLREAAEQVLQDAVAEIEEQYPDPLEKLRDHISAEDDALWDTVLDEYPMPDPDFLSDELEQNYGYMDGDLLPLSKDRAAELLERDLTIYAIVDGGQAEMVFDRDDLEERPPDMMFGVPKEEWEASPEFHQAIVDRMNHQEEREKAFLDHSGDCFAIYQVKHSEEQRDLRFMDMDWLTSKGLTADRANYELAYTGELTFGQDLSALEKLYERFNIDHPADYHRPSMSVSDIVALKQGGVVSFHYCDSVGFVAIPDFIKPENYLKAAEMAMEDDYGMIDGIINNGPKEQPEKKPSVREKLKNQPKQEQKRTAPKRSAERDR